MLVGTEVSFDDIAVGPFLHIDAFASVRCDPVAAYLVAAAAVLSMLPLFFSFVSHVSRVVSRGGKCASPVVETSARGLAVNNMHTPTRGGWAVYSCSTCCR